MTENLALINIEQQLRLLGENSDYRRAPPKSRAPTSDALRGFGGPSRRIFNTKQLGVAIWQGTSASESQRLFNGIGGTGKTYCPLGADETRRAPALLLPERRTLRTQSRRWIDKGLHSSTHLSLLKSYFTSASSLSSTK